ncbi:MAG: ABC transporter permease [Halanaerobiales bacterium]|nr:ABC transporter permease [Halanaerobiales bacterium]
MFGIKRRQIGRMLFYENILMGILALTTGILAGSLLSKLFVMILFRLMDYTTYVQYFIIPEAILNTVIIFAVLFLLTSIHGFTLIYRFKPIELFKAEKAGDKEPKTSIIIAIGSIILIGTAYYIALNFKFIPNFILYALSTVSLVIIGSFGFFSASTLFLIKLAKKNKKRYYKGVNMIGTSQLLYRIKGHARTLALISILSATTLTAMGVTFSLAYDLAKNVDNQHLYSYEYISSDKSLNQKVENVIKKYPTHEIIKSVEIDLLHFQGALIDTETAPYVPGNRFYLISQNKINEVLNHLGIENLIKINHSNEVVIFNQYFRERFEKSYVGMTAKINYNNKKEFFKVTDLKKYNFLNHYLPGLTMVVHDDIYKRLLKDAEVRRFNVYEISNKKKSEQLTKEIEQIVPKDADLKSYYTSYRTTFESKGISLFIGSFLGLVFLVATGSIIYFKQLTEANAEKARYKILTNIGVSKKEIGSSIARQILFVFALPLILGIIHSIVGLIALSKMINANLIVPVTYTIGAYTLIYLIYYVLTVSSYSKIVNSNE